MALKATVFNTQMDIGTPVDYFGQFNCMHDVSNEVNTYHFDPGFIPLSWYFMS